MSKLFKNGLIYYKQKFQEKDIIVDDNGIVVIAELIDLDLEDFEEIIDCTGLHILPGFVDMNISISDEFDREEIRRISDLLASGGFSFGLVQSPQFNSVSRVQEIQKKMDDSSKIELHPVNTVSANLEDILSMEEVSYLFKGSIEEDVLKEVESCNGVFITPWESDEQLKRDLEIVHQTKCQCHFIGIENGATLEILKKAKELNPQISCEIEVKKLLFGESKEIFIKALQEGVIDFITIKEMELKPKFVGLIYTNLVREKKISLEKMVSLLTVTPSEKFGFIQGEINNLERANLSFFDFIAREKMKNQESLPQFDHHWVMGVCCMSIMDGLIVYRNRI